MTNDYSLADIRAATEGGNDRNGGWGNWSSWIILFLIFAIFGWGGRGMGGFGGFSGGSSGGVQDGYVLASDIARVQQTITSGLCDGFYNTSQLINGVQMQAANNTAALQSTMTQSFAGLNTGMVQQGYENRIAVNGIGQQLANCCCDIRSDIAGINYNNAMNTANVQRQISDCCCDTQRQIERGFCDVGYGMNTNTTAIVQNAHNDADRILARIDKMESDRQQERIAQLQNDNAALKFQISQEAQNNYLVSRLDPNRCPVPAYVVQPPQQVSFPVNCCGVASYTTNSGCGCAG